MNFRRNQGGFIFSLDAALAMLVVMIVVAGVARVSGPGLTYGQQGYLRLERYANDALEVMQLTGTLDRIIEYVKHGDLENAESLAENELRKILPNDVQFRLVIGYGDNARLDNIYPTTGSEAEWYAAFLNADEVATAARVSAFSPRENIKVLVWLDAGDEYEENFTRELLACTNMENKSTSSVSDFWAEIDAHRNYTEVWDVVFLPDAQDVATGAYWAKMGHFGEYLARGGRVVAGGETLLNNSQYEDYDGEFWEAMGVEWSVPPTTTSGLPLDYMYIIDGDNFVTAPYENRDDIKYNENHAQYVYTPLDNEWVVAQWEETPTGVPSPLPGIIVRPAGYSHPDGTLTYPGVLFNMRFVRSAMDSDNPRGTRDWITLVKRAMGYEEVFEPITLYVWRGPAVG